MENRCSSFILSRFSMAAENIVGDLLERYLNAKGWGWRMHIMGPCQEEHIEYLARSFHESRLPRKHTPPTTVPDEVVSIVLNISFNIQPENLERIKEEHRFSMAAENIVGDLAEKLEPRSEE